MLDIQRQYTVRAEPLVFTVFSSGQTESSILFSTSSLGKLLRTRAERISCASIFLTCFCSHPIRLAISSSKNSTSTTTLLTDNNTRVSYTYCQEGYVSSSGGRAIAGLIMVFTALGLLGFVVYYSAKQMGYLK